MSRIFSNLQALFPTTTANTILIARRINGCHISFSALHSDLQLVQRRSLFQYVQRRELCTATVTLMMTRRISGLRSSISALHSDLQQVSLLTSQLQRTSQVYCLRYNSQCGDLCTTSLAIRTDGAHLRFNRSQPQVQGFQAQNYSQVHYLQRRNLCTTPVILMARRIGRSRNTLESNPESNAKSHHHEHQPKSQPQQEISILIFAPPILTEALKEKPRGWVKALGDNAKRTGLAAKNLSIGAAAQIALNSIIKKVQTSQFPMKSSAAIKIATAPAPPLINQAVHKLIFNVLDHNPIKIVKDADLSVISYHVIQACIQFGMATTFESAPSERRIKRSCNSDSNEEDTPTSIPQITFTNEKAAVMTMIELGEEFDLDGREAEFGLSIGGDANSSPDQLTGDAAKGAAEIKIQQQDANQLRQKLEKESKNKGFQPIEDNDDNDEEVETKNKKDRSRNLWDEDSYDPELEFEKQLHKQEADRIAAYEQEMDAREMDKFIHRHRGMTSKYKEIPFQLGKMPNERLRKREMWHKSVTHQRLSTDMTLTMQQILSSKLVPFSFDVGQIAIEKIEFSVDMQNCFIYWSAQGEDVVGTAVVVLIARTDWLMCLFFFFFFVGIHHCGRS